MNHLLIGREYPPAPGGGIGTYMQQISALLAQAGETIHVITQQVPGAPVHEVLHNGRVIVHRLPTAPFDAQDRALATPFGPRLFAWRAAALAEKLITDEQIDIVEGAEFEAPLYFLQQRRLAGLGPARQPPILVHMHGATEVVLAHDLHDPGSPYNCMASRLETFSIRQAEYLLFPSRYYADQARMLYGFNPARSEVIPYPISPLEPITRPDAVWQNGSLLLVGRLERRKGILEWIEAAATLARRHPSLRFEFAGANSLIPEWGTADELLHNLVPSDLRERFIFHGQLTPAQLQKVRAAARIAVVPSRWDNLPFACLEAMSSGLPVLSTASCGAPEVLRDGVDGWISPTCTTLDLLRTAERALAVSSADLARYGANASEQVRSVCDNTQTLACHLELRKTLCRRSPSSNRTVSIRPAVTCQRVARDNDAANLFSAARSQHSMLGADAYLLHETGEQPNDRFVPAALAVLTMQPEVAVVGAWTADPAGKPLISPDPDVPSQLLATGMTGPLVVRATFLTRLRQVQDTDSPELARATAMLEALQDGWRCVCLPEILSRQTAWMAVPGHMTHTALQRALHSRFPDLTAVHAAQLIAWVGSPFAMLANSQELPERAYDLIISRLRSKLGPVVRVRLRRTSHRWQGRLSRLLKTLQLRCR